MACVMAERKLSRYRFSGETEPSFTYRFERELEILTGVRYCLGMNSCTSALLVGAWAAGIEPGDEVIVPAYTFVAPMAVAAYTGADLVLAEVDESLTLDPADVAARITPRTKAVIAVHMLGSPCNLAALREVTSHSGLILIEDCAQAGGGSYRGKALGTHGLFGAFSLNIFKTFTAGDGGVLLTDDESLYRRSFAIHDHGAAPFRLGVADAGGLLGLNFRMHELTGALAWAQVRKLPSILARLRRLKTALRTAIGSLPCALPARIHDPDGDCATVLPYIFSDAAIAREVAAILKTSTLAQSGKHNYANIPQLAEASVPRAIHGRSGKPRAYRRGALPRTDDLLSRTVALSVGVRDSYLGTPFGISIRADQRAVEATAQTFRAAVEQVMR